MNYISPKLFHLYGPFYIHSYGLFIALGLVTFIWLSMKDARRHALVSKDLYISIIIRGIFCALIGGRLLFIINNLSTIDSMNDLFTTWNGGFSILGSIIAVLCIMPFYLKKQNVSIVPFLDFVAIYTPLLQSISRIGCFMAGCCYGKPTTAFWAVIYGHSDASAPLHIPLHPTQLYSTVMLFVVFLVLFYFSRYYHLTNGTLLLLYLMLVSTERFMLDAIRGDQQFYSYPFLSLLTINQWIALIMFLASGIGFLAITYYTKRHEYI